MPGEAESTLLCLPIRAGDSLPPGGTSQEAAPERPRRHSESQGTQPHRGPSACPSATAASLGTARHRGWFAEVELGWEHPLRTVKQPRESSTEID